MKRLATAVTQHPWRVLVVWVVAILGLSMLTSPGGIATTEDVMKSDPAAFLPQKYESARSARLEQRACEGAESGTDFDNEIAVTHRELGGHPLDNPRFLEEILAASTRWPHADLFEEFSGRDRKRAHDQLATTSIALGAIENSAGDVPTISPSTCTSAGVEAVTFTRVVV